MAVEARFTTAITEISARSQFARHFLDNARDCSTGKRIKTHKWRMVIPSGGITCLNYNVDLREAAQAGRLNRILDSSNIVVSPSLWMWRPRLHGSNKIRVQFRLPEGVDAFVPWAAIDDLDNTYLLGASPESGTAIAVFGEFGSATQRVGGAELTIALLNSQGDIDRSAVIDWVRETAEIITLAYGRFPNPSAKVIVIPVGGNSWGSDSAVPFGRVVRDGGETIELLVNENKPISEFYEGWTATHEFSHLMLPYLHRNQRWISEGFAQYFQNVLLSRAGQYTEEYAWQELHDGFERGRQSVPDLSPNQAARDEERNTRMKIYWSGAALALMADVELRRRSGGRESLDIVLGRLQRCCLPSPKTWSGRDLFTTLDTLIDEPLFMNLYHQYADTNGFPDVRPVLQKLGVATDDDGFRLLDNAELAAVRTAISAPVRRSATGMH